MQTNGRSGDVAPGVLISALDEGDGSFHVWVSVLARGKKRYPHWTGGWVGSRTDSDFVVNENILIRPNSNPSQRSPKNGHHTGSAMPACISSNTCRCKIERVQRKFRRIFSGVTGRQTNKSTFRIAEIEMLTAGYRINGLICQWFMLNDILLNSVVEKISYSGRLRYMDRVRQMRTITSTSFSAKA